MADLTLALRLTADGKDLVGEVRVARTAVDRLGDEIRGTDRAADRLDKTARRSAAGLRGWAAGLLGAGGVVYAAKNAADAIVGAGVAQEGWEARLRAATGSAQAAREELSFLRGEAERLGLDYGILADASSNFAAASRGTTLEGAKQREILIGVAEAARVMQLSNDDLLGVMTALEQIVSKGTVSAEELRGQLGERLPGAFQIAARAMGVTTSELGDMLQKGEVLAEDLLPKLAKELRLSVADGLPAAVDGAAAAFARWDNALRDLSEAIANSGVLDFLAKAAEGAAGVVRAVSGLEIPEAVDARTPERKLRDLEVRRSRLVREGAPTGGGQSGRQARLAHAKELADVNAAIEAQTRLLPRNIGETVEQTNTAYREALDAVGEKLGNSVPRVGVEEFLRTEANRQNSRGARGGQRANARDEARTALGLLEELRRLQNVKTFGTEAGAAGLTVEQSPIVQTKAPGPAPQATEPTISKEELDRRKAARNRFEDLQASLRTETEAIEAAYRERLEVVRAAGQEETEAGREALDRAAADRDAQLAAIAEREREEKRREIEYGHQLHREAAEEKLRIEQERIAREAELRREAKEQELLEAQGFRDRAAADELAHQEQLIAARNQYSQRIAEAEALVERARAQTGAQRVQTELEIGKSLLQGAAQHNAKAFRAYQALSVSQAVIAGHKAVALALAEGPAGYLKAAVVGAAVAAEVAQILAQKPPTAYARGGVVDSPTFFSARGLANGGVAGEAGPEAILPLRRMRDGRLGVGGGSTRNINFQPSTSVTVVVEGGSAEDGQVVGDAARREVGDLFHAMLETEKRPGGALNPVEAV